MIEITKQQAIDAYTKIFTPLSSWQLTSANLQGLIEEMNAVANASSVEEAKKLLLEKYEYTFYKEDNIDEMVYNLRKELDAVSIQDAEIFANINRTKEINSIIKELINVYGTETILDILKDAKEQLEAE